MSAPGVTIDLNLNFRDLTSEINQAAAQLNSLPPAAQRMASGTNAAFTQVASGAQRMSSTVTSANHQAAQSTAQFSAAVSGSMAQVSASVNNAANRFGNSYAVISSGSHRAAADVESGFSRIIGAVKGGVAAYIGIHAAVQGFNALLNSQRAYDTTVRGLEAITGTAGAAQQKYGFLQQEADRLGISLRSSAKDFLQLTAATQGTALEGQETEKLFIAMAAAGSKLGLSQEKMHDAFVATQQIAAKGTVSLEELRGQLSEALPVAMNVAARGMGMTTSELMKLVASGQLASKDFLIPFRKELEKQYDTGNFDSLENSIQRIGNFLDEAKLKLSAYIGLQQAVKGFADTIGAGVPNTQPLNKNYADATVASAKKELFDINNKIKSAEEWLNLSSDLGKNKVTNILSGSYFIYNYNDKEINDLKKRKQELEKIIDDSEWKSQFNDFSSIGVNVAEKMQSDAASALDAINIPGIQKKKQELLEAIKLPDLPSVPQYTNELEKYKQRILQQEKISEDAKKIFSDLRQKLALKSGSKEEDKNLDYQFKYEGLDKKVSQNEQLYALNLAALVAYEAKKTEAEKEARQELEKSNKEEERRKEVISGTISSLQFEIEVEKKNGIEKQKQIELHDKLKNAKGEEVAQITAAVNAKYDQIIANEKARLAAESAAKAQVSAMIEEMSARGLTVAAITQELQLREKINQSIESGSQKGVSAAEIETLERKNAQLEQNVHNELLLLELKADSKQTGYLLVLAEQLKLSGLNNEQIKSRIELEKQILAIKSQNPGVDSNEARSLVESNAIQQQKLNVILENGVEKSANLVESAYKRAFENIHDSWTKLIEQVLSGQIKSADEFSKAIGSAGIKSLSNILTTGLDSLIGNAFTGGKSNNSNVSSGAFSGIFDYFSDKPAQKTTQSKDLDTSNLEPGIALDKSKIESVGTDFSGVLSGSSMGAGLGQTLGGFVFDESKQKSVNTASTVGALAGSIIGAFIGGKTGSLIGGAGGGLLGGLLGGFMTATPKASASYYLNSNNVQSFVSGSSTGGGDLAQAKNAARKMTDPRYFAGLEGETGVDFGGFLLTFEQAGKDFSVKAKNVFGTFVDTAVTAGDQASYEAAMRKVGAKLIKQSVDDLQDEALREVARQEGKLKKILAGFVDVREIRVLTGASGEMSIALKDLNAKFNVLEVSARKYGLSLDDLSSAQQRQTELLKYQAETNLRQLAGVGESFNSLLTKFVDDLIKARGNFATLGLSSDDLNSLTQQSIAKFKSDSLVPFTDLKTKLAESLKLPPDLSQLNTLIADGLKSLKAANDPFAEIAKIVSIEDAVNKRYQAEQQAVNGLKQNYDSIKQFNDSFKLSDFSYLSPVEKLKEAERAFNEQFDIAKKTGDTSKLIDAEKKYIDIARGFWGETSPFFTIVKTIEAANNQLESGLQNQINQYGDIDSKFNDNIKTLYDFVDYFAKKAGVIISTGTDNIKLPETGVSATSKLSELENIRGQKSEAWNDIKDKLTVKGLSVEDKNNLKSALALAKYEFDLANLDVLIEQAIENGNTKRADNLKTRKANLKPPKVDYKAGGGVADGFVVVGESGEELVKLPSGSRVYNNNESRSIVNQSQSDKIEKLEQMVNELKTSNKNQKTIIDMMSAANDEMINRLKRLDASNEAIKEQLAVRR